MSQSHGWDEDSIRNYEANKAKAKFNAEIERVENLLADVTVRYPNDEFAQRVEKSHICNSYQHLSEHIPAIREFLEEEEHRESIHNSN